jgi:sulfate transport system ATP-binding protein
LRIRIDSLSKSFGRSRILEGLSLDFSSGELIALVGPSGSGKTTLLRLLAGLEIPNAGRVLFGDRDVTHLDPGLRKVGLVFQHYALFRHMRVSANVSFGLRARPRSSRLPRAEIDRRVEEMLSLVQLDGLGSRYPSELSGGQRQRVGLARALAAEPDVLLLDEPFGALDTPVRKDLRRWLRAFHEKLPVTTVLVTHDREEALELADRMVVLEGGRIRQAGTPGELYHCPADAFVCAFLGEANIFDAEVRGGLLRFRDDGAPVPLSRRVPDGPVAAYVRPHDISLRLAARGAPQDGLPSVIDRVLPAGPTLRVSLHRIDTGETFLAEIPHGPIGSRDPAPGDAVIAALRIAHAYPRTGAGGPIAGAPSTRTPRLETEPQPATEGNALSKTKASLALGPATPAFRPRPGNPSG